MGILFVFVMLGLSLACAIATLFFVYRNSKDSQRQSNLMLKALVKNANDMNEFDSKLKKINTTVVQSLSFHQKAFDHQRMLVMSMNQQLKTISQLMASGPQSSTNNQRSVSGTKSSNLNSLTKTRTLTSSFAKSTASNEQAVVRLQDLFISKAKAAPSVDLDTENTVKMPDRISGSKFSPQVATQPVRQDVAETRRVANG